MEELQKEWYELTKKYVSYFFRTSRSALRNYNSLEDVVSDTYLHFLEKGLFEKYEEKITSKKYFIMSAVRNYMTDLLRKQRETYSLDYTFSTEEGEEITLGETIEDKENRFEVLENDMDVQSILSVLPDSTNSKVEGNSPLYGKCNMSLRMIAAHVAAGYTSVEIANMYINPANQKPVTLGRIHQLFGDIRMILDPVMGV